MDTLFVPLGGYGRNVNHDPASRAYRVARGEVVVKDAGWEIAIAPLDQGDLGRCVPTAGTAMLATDPFWGRLPETVRQVLRDPVLAEQFAEQAYRDVTRLDPFQGSWEPDDTGSDGLSLAKLWKARGYISGYQHVMSLNDAHAAIQKGPYPIGISWMSGMDTPRPDGTVNISGSNRGGHEVLLYRYDKGRDLWWCRNSWSAAWGLKGDFAFDSAGYQKLMDMRADGTPMTPAALPAPQPTPVAPDAFPFLEMNVWLERVKRFPRLKPAYERAAAKAYENWRSSL